MKIFEAMVFKRAIGTRCSLNVKMLDTINDGIVLSIDQNLVNSNELSFITDFVNQHKLSLLLEQRALLYLDKCPNPIQPIHVGKLELLNPENL